MASPETIEALKTIGQGLGFIVTIITGVYGGKKLERRKGNGSVSIKLVPQGECTLRHEAENERWKNLLNISRDIKKDIREINRQLNIKNRNEE